MNGVDYPLHSSAKSRIEAREMNWMLSNQPLASTEFIEGFAVTCSDMTSAALVNLSRLGQMDLRERLTVGASATSVAQQNA
jgi:hypothetical protein